MVRRTLYRLVHQQTLISPCGEDDGLTDAVDADSTGDDLTNADDHLMTGSNRMDVT
jgi:hypothetical protein